MEDFFSQILDPEKFIFAIIFCMPSGRFFFFLLLLLLLVLYLRFPPQEALACVRMYDYYLKFPKSIAEVKKVKKEKKNKS
jgi:hypothetical protein